MARLFTKSIYDPIEKKDGQRILVTRLWPRGIKKITVASWLKDLAPSYSLLRSYKDKKIPWPEFSRRYKAGLKGNLVGKQLRKLKQLAKKRTITLLCSCKKENHCHRSLLKKRIEK